MSEHPSSARLPNRLRPRLRTKIIGFFAVSIVLTAAIAVYVGWSATYENAAKRLADKGALLVTLYADGAGGAVRFGKTGDLASRFSSLIDHSVGEITEVVVITADGEVLLQVPESAPVGAAGRDLAVSALRADGGEATRGEFSAAAPVTFGADGQVVGAIAITWTNAVMINELRGIAWWQMLTSFTAAFVVSAAGYLFLRRTLFKPLRGLTEAVEGSLAGKTVEFPGQSRNDSIGDLSRAMAGIQARTGELRTVRVALDRASVAIAMVDADFQIIYCNNALIETVRRCEDYWRERIPGFSVDKLTNTSIDRFHKNPEHQRSRLRGLRGRHQAEIEFGGFVAGLDIMPVDDDQGKRTGYVLQWHDRTAQRAAETQIEQVIAGARDGNFSTRIEIDSSNAFVSTVADGINHLCGNVAGFLGDIDQALAGLARGDLTSSVKSDYRGQLGEIALRVDQTAQEIDRLVGQITGVASGINRATREISTGSTELSARAESQAASLEETAATMEEIAATVKTNAENAARANGLAAETRSQAEHGRSVIAETVQAMSNIRDSAAEIGDIVTTIDAIAFQTNLLALNAAVEAARAGDAGKGFAVVASEVRTLAQRSGEAAKTIKDLIDKSTGLVADGDRLVGATDTALSEILDGVRNVARTIEEISAASREQTSGVDEVSIAVSQMDEMTQQNASMADESAASARSLTEQSETLVELVRFFTTRDSRSGGAAAQDIGAWDRDVRSEKRQATGRKEGPRKGSPEKPDARPRPAKAAAGGADWAEF